MRYFCVLWNAPIEWHTDLRRGHNDSGRPLWLRPIELFVVGAIVRPQACLPAATSPLWESDSWNEALLVTVYTGERWSQCVRRSMARDEPQV